MLYKIAQKILFQLDPEFAHNITMKGLKTTQNTLLDSFFLQNIDSPPIKAMGIEFPNIVGLAAGMDKDGEAVDAFAAMGFGHIEVGTVTPRAQPGNLKPRLFRLKPAKAIINRMGFNNKGIDHLLENLRHSQRLAKIGINIGKNKDTPIEEGLNDYLICLEKSYLHADYIAINISSPNTPNLRQLQYGEMLDELLYGLRKEQLELANKHNKYVPLAVKVAPDLDTDEIKSISTSLLKHDIDGLIATNTTLTRPAVDGLKNAQEAGGLSGKPLTALSTQIIKQFAMHLDNKIDIIGVGGINSTNDAKDKIDAGSKLVQLYSGFIYQGPKLIKDIITEIK